MQNEVPKDIYSMCHVDFHIINTTLHNYLLDQNYFAFCSTNEKGKIDTENYESRVLQNNCPDRFVSQTVSHKRKRDKVKEERENMRDRMKKMRENRTTANRQKRDEANASRLKRKNSKSRVLHSVCRERFVSENVPQKRKRDKVKEERENTKNKKEERRDNIAREKREKTDKIDREKYESRVLHNDCRDRFVSQTVSHKRKRDKVKEERENMRDRMKKMRENRRTADRQKTDEVNALSIERTNYKSRVLHIPELIPPNVCRKQKNKHNELCCIDESIVRFKQKVKMHKKTNNDCQDRFVSQTVSHKRKRDKVKEERENMRDRMKKMRENRRTANKTENR